MRQLTMKMINGIVIYYDIQHRGRLPKDIEEPLMEAFITTYSEKPERLSCFYEKQIKPLDILLSPYFEYWK